MVKGPQHEWITCALCRGPLSLVLDLGATPLANELPVGGARPETFPLRLVQCGKCQHLQIDHHVSPERMYRNYVYVSNTSHASREHFGAYAMRMTERFSPSFVVDIGGNDALFASCFNCKALVVDPAENIKSEWNVPRVVAFFDGQVAADVEKKHGKADLITCNNAFAHNADLTPILKGVKALLADRGTFVFEVAYAMPLLKRGLFDLIYHEHIHHWTATAAIPFLREHGLELYDAEELPTHGGSLRFYARHLVKGNKRASANLPGILASEEHGLSDAVSRCPQLVKEERQMARRIIADTAEPIGLLGYPAKACTLLSYWGIGNDVQSVFDDNENKIGKRTHFGHVIHPTSAIKPASTLLIASWNYADELMRRFQGHRFLIPHPFRAAT